MSGAARPEIEEHVNGEGHEGGFIALVEDGDGADGFRRLAGDGDREVSVLQVGCCCGWRSARFTAPPGTRWVRGGVAVAPSYQTQAMDLLGRLWRWHLAEPLNVDNVDN